MKTDPKKQSSTIPAEGKGTYKLEELQEEESWDRKDQNCQKSVDMDHKSLLLSNACNHY